MVKNSKTVKLNQHEQSNFELFKTYKGSEMRKLIKWRRSQLRKGLKLAENRTTLLMGMDDCRFEFLPPDSHLQTRFYFLRHLTSDRIRPPVKNVLVPLDFSHVNRDDKQKLKQMTAPSKPRWPAHTALLHIDVQQRAFILYDISMGKVDRHRPTPPLPPNHGNSENTDFDFQKGGPYELYKKKVKRSLLRAIKKKFPQWKDFSFVKVPMATNAILEDSCAVAAILRIMAIATGKGKTEVIKLPGRSISVRKIPHREQPVWRELACELGTFNPPLQQQQQQQQQGQRRRSTRSQCKKLNKCNRI